MASDNKIYAIGDSHAAYTFHDLPKTLVYHVGPVTMHRIGRDQPILNEHLHIQKDGLWIFCFGEIDVRCHVFKQSQLRPEIDVLRDLASRYEQAILKQNHPHIAILGIVPPTRFHPSKQNPEYPMQGSDQDRLRYTTILNQYLYQICLKNQWVFLHLNPFYQDKEGFMQESLSDGTVHIGDNSRVQTIMNLQLW